MTKAKEKSEKEADLFKTKFFEKFLKNIPSKGGKVVAAK